MFKLKCSINSKNISKLLKFNSEKNFINKQKFNFSTADKFKNLFHTSTDNSKSQDFFERNFQFNTVPENMTTYNDLDLGMASEVFKNIDLENLSTAPLFSGRFSRLWCLTEDTFHHIVMFLTNDLNFGMGSSILFLAVFLRLVFYPVTKKNMKNIQLTRLLHPEITEYNERMKKLQTAGEAPLIKIERKKLIRFKENYGIKSSPLIFALSLVQGFFLLSWASLVHRFSFHIEDYPQMISGGFFWFRDLSMSDPYFILPAINTILIIFNLYNSNSVYSNPILLKSRRILFLAPLFSFPVMCTIETGLILYICATSATHFIINAYLNSEYMKKKLGLVNFLPGSKLEKLNRFRLLNNKFEDTNLIFKSPTEIPEAPSNIEKVNKKEKSKEANVSGNIKRPIQKPLNKRTNK